MKTKGRGVKHLRKNVNGKEKIGNGKTEQLDSDDESNASYEDCEETDEIYSQRTKLQQVQSARSVIDARIQSTEELDVLQADLEKVGTDLLNRHAELTDLHQELCSRKGNKSSLSRKRKSSPGASTASKSPPIRLKIKRLYDSDGEYVSEEPCTSAQASNRDSKAAANDSTPCVGLSELHKNPKVQSYFYAHNDFPDKYWQFVDEFTAPIRRDELALLKDILKEYEGTKAAKYFKTPINKNKTNNSSGSGGSKYKVIKKSPAEAAAHLIASRGEKLVVKRRRNSTASSGSAETKITLRRLPSRQNSVVGMANGTGTPVSVTSSAGSSSSSKVFNGRHVGEIATQEIVHCFAERHPTSPSIKTSPGKVRRISGNSVSMKPLNGLSTPNSLLKALNIPNLGALEGRISKELQKCGFVELKSDEEAIDGDLLSDDGGSSDDEISVEIRRRQKELKQIQSLNKQRLQKLLEIAERDLERQEVQSQLDIVEAEVDSLCDRFCNAVPQQIPTKKDKELIIKTLQERSEFIEQVDKIETPSCCCSNIIP